MWCRCLVCGGVLWLVVLGCVLVVVFIFVLIVFESRRWVDWVIIVTMIVVVIATLASGRTHLCRGGRSPCVAFLFYRIRVWVLLITTLYKLLGELQIRLEIICLRSEVNHMSG